MMSNPIPYIIQNCIPDSVENLLVLTDATTKWIIDYFTDGSIRKRIEFEKVPVGICHGEEPSREIFEKMVSSQSIICVTQYSLAHTNARFEAYKRGIPFLSMPGYDERLIGNVAFFVDYKSICPKVDLYADALSDAKTLQVYTSKGTDLTLDVNGRRGNSCPGLTDEWHLLGSPPDIEANISPIENATNGIIVVDGSITDSRIGLLEEDVILKIEHGAVVDIVCENQEIESVTKRIFEDARSKKAYIVGELGIGFNDAAKLCGNMLIDEGAANCIHFGIGSNWTIGGDNKVNFHLDFVVKDASLKADGNSIIEKGKLLYGN